MNMRALTRHMLCVQGMRLCSLKHGRRPNKWELGHLRGARQALDRVYRCSLHCAFAPTISALASGQWTANHPRERTRRAGGVNVVSHQRRYEVLPRRGQSFQQVWGNTAACMGLETELGMPTGDFAPTALFAHFTTQKLTISHNRYSTRNISSV